MNIQFDIDQEEPARKTPKARRGSQSPPKRSDFAPELKQENKAFESAHKRAKETQAKLESTLKYLQSNLDKRGSTKAQKMTVKSMQISMTAFLKAIEEAEGAAKSPEEHRKATYLHKLATTGEIGKEVNFYSTMSQDTSGTRRSSARRSSLARASQERSQPNRRSRENSRSGSLSSQPGLGTPHNQSMQTNDLGDDRQRCGSIEIEDPFIVSFEDLKDATRSFKSEIHKVRQLMADQRTMSVKQTLEQDWQDLVTLQVTLEGILEEYQLGPRLHPHVNVRERKSRSEQYINFCALVMDDIQKDYTFVSQLKFVEDSQTTHGKQKSQRGNITPKRSASQDAKFGFVSLEAQQRFRLKSVRDEREAITGKKIGDERARPWDPASAEMMEHISEADKYDEMGTMGNLDQSSRSIPLSQALYLSRKSKASRAQPVERVPVSSMEEEKSASGRPRKYKTINPRIKNASKIDAPNSGCCAEQQCTIF